MANALAQNVPTSEVAIRRSSARLRGRVIALLDSALERSGKTQVDLAKALGVRKSAVNQVLRGNGNVQMDTLAEYLGEMGFEADIVVAKLGEFRSARAERRSPRLEELTIADQDRRSDQAIAIYASSAPEWDGKAANKVSVRARSHNAAESSNRSTSNPVPEKVASPWR